MSSFILLESRHACAVTSRPHRGLADQREVEKKKETSSRRRSWKQEAKRGKAEQRLLMLLKKNFGRERSVFLLPLYFELFKPTVQPRLRLARARGLSVRCLDTAEGGKIARFAPKWTDQRLPDEGSRFICPPWQSTTLEWTPAYCFFITLKAGRDIPHFKPRPWSILLEYFDVWTSPSDSNGARAGSQS